MIDVAVRLRSALVNSYRPWVEGRLAELEGGTLPGVGEAVAEGERWLAASLEELLALPFAEQRRGPLEVFQEAMAIPTAALVEAGVDPVTRDAAAREALPGDLYDLAPASSSVLGEETWQAHLAWGAAKARSFLADG